MLYSGPISPDEVFDPNDPICQVPILLVGDDFSGGHLGYLKNSGSWQLCSFDHMSVTGGPSEIHFRRCGGDPVMHPAAGWLGRGAEKSALAAKSW
jgi:hypothetical protein